MLGTEPEIKGIYVKTGQVKLIFNPVLDRGDHSVQAHQAVECADEQGQFWPLHDILFERQSELFGGDIRETIKTLAVNLDLNSDQFNLCIDEQRYVDTVQAWTSGAGSWAFAPVPPST